MPLIKPLSMLALTVTTCALAVSFAGCMGGEESCSVEETRAWLSVKPTGGLQSLDTMVRVDGRGAACGCCDGTPSTHLIAYRLDADGDGAFEHESTKPIAMNLHFEAPGAYKVTAEVEDNNGTKAQQSVEVQVLGDSAP